MRGLHLAQGLLAEFGRSIGLPGLTLDAQGACYLLIGDDLPVAMHCDDAAARLLLAACLPLPPPEPEALFRAMLAANAARRWELSLGLDEASGALVLFGQITLVGLDAAHFIRMVEEFVAESERWREVIAQAPAIPAEGPPPAHGIRA